MATERSLLEEIPFGFKGKIYRSPMPFGPYDRSNSVWETYLGANIKLVVVLVEKQEYLVHACRDLPMFYQSNGLNVINFPIPDYHAPPNLSDTKTAIEKVIIQAECGDNIAVHCMAGIGRTGTFLACIAKQQFCLTGHEAIEWIREYIPGALENEHQENFVMNY